MDRSRAGWLLANRVNRTLSKAGATAPGLPLADERVARVAVPVGRVNPFRWLSGQRLLPKLYWSGREDGLVVAAVGAAGLLEGDVLEEADALRKRLAPLLASGDPGLRYYGGLRFDPTREPGVEWAGFGAYSFVMP